VEALHGLGFVEPLTTGRKPRSHPELMRYLARELAMNVYDLKHIARLIFSSHATSASHCTQPDPSPKAASSPDRRAAISPPSRWSFAFPQRRQAFRLRGAESESAGDRAPKQFLNMGAPGRAWQLTALSTSGPRRWRCHRQSLVDVMTTFAGGNRDRTHHHARRRSLADADSDSGQRDHGDAHRAPL